MVGLFETDLEFHLGQVMWVSERPTRSIIVCPNYKSSSNLEPNRRLFAVEGVSGHFVFLVKMHSSAHSCRFTWSAIFCAFFLPSLLSAAQLCNNTPKQLKKVIFPGVLAFLSTHVKHSSVCCPAFLTDVPNENRLHPRVSTFSMT